MYDVLSEFVPKLNINTTKSTKISRPEYVNMEDNNIYSWVNVDKTFFTFEQLGTTSWSYNQYEITVYITSDSKSDPHNRFDKGIDHICHQLQLSQDGLSVPKGIEIGKFTKTICALRSMTKGAECIHSCKEGVRI